MSDYDNDLDQDDQDSPDEKPTPNWRRKLEKDAEDGRLAKQQANDAKRELAFYKAGLPMDDPRLAYFVKGYDGAYDPDAIRKAAQDAGFISPSEQDTAREEEVAQHQQLAQASAGASSAGKLTHADILNLARKAADSAPMSERAAVYASVLAEHGLNKVRMQQ
jgi:hypothetical protein